MSWVSQNRRYKFKEEDLKRILRLGDLDMTVGEYLKLLNGINGYMDNIDDLANYLVRNWLQTIPNLKLFELIKYLEAQNANTIGRNERVS
jgi:hypothetical protein